jgi:hypothetical protein
VWVRTLPALLLVMAFVHAPLLLYAFLQVGADEGASRESRCSAALGASTATVATSILTMVAQGILIHIVIQAIRRQPDSVGTAFRIGLSRFFPLLGIGIVTALVAVLFLIPMGVLMFVMREAAYVFVVLALLPLTAWYVAPSVTVVEKLGVGKSLARVFA